MTEFSNLTIARRATLVAEGWRFADGLPCEGGYRAARDGGGYRAAVTPTPSPCVMVTPSCPGYHAEVAWKAEAR